MIKLRKLFQKLRYWWFRHKNKQQLLSTPTFESVLELLGQLPVDDFSLSAKQKRSTIFKTNFETYNAYSDAIMLANRAVFTRNTFVIKTKEIFNTNVDDYFLDNDRVPTDEVRVLTIIKTSLSILKENIENYLLHIF